MICRYKYLYCFLLTAPFFNILTLNFGPLLLQVYIFCFFVGGFLISRIQPIRAVWSASFLMMFGLILFLLVSEFNSLINLGKTNIGSIRFFGLFIPVLLFYVGFINSNRFCNKYFDKLLRFYIYVFSFSIFIDYFFIHSSLDISLQPMFIKDDFSYHSRPFGITGQPSVNSVLLVFFYTLLISRVGFTNNKGLFFLIIIGVFLQGSGSGFLVLAMLLLVMSLRLNWIYRFVLYPCFVVLLVYSSQHFTFVSKISFRYISEMFNVFIHQTQSWITGVVNSEIGPVNSLLFGGVSSGIDFGPLYIVSNVGLIYFVLFLITIILAAVKARERYERLAILLLCAGSLHYLAFFYLIVAFFFPLILQKNLFPAKTICVSSEVEIC